jgi:hypothetical protein
MRTVNVYLTEEVCAYLATDPEDLVITQVDECGGVFVERAECVGEEGSGVWIDALGYEHVSPIPDVVFAESDKAKAFHEKTDMPVDG